MKCITEALNYLFLEYVVNIFNEDFLLEIIIYWLILLNTNSRFCIIRKWYTRRVDTF